MGQRPGRGPGRCTGRCLRDMEGDLRVGDGENHMPDPRVADCGAGVGGGLGFHYSRHSSETRVCWMRGHVLCFCCDRVAFSAATGLCRRQCWLAPRRLPCPRGNLEPTKQSFPAWLPHPSHRLSPFCLWICSSGRFISGLLQHETFCVWLFFT